MGTKKTSSWGYSIFILLIAIGSFWVFKQFLPDRIFSETAELDKEHISTDEWMKEAMETDADTLTVNQDSLLVEEAEKKADSLENAQQKQDPLVDVMEESFEEGYFLTHFYEKLYQLLENPDQSKVRIAYFGDSMTDGDLIVQDVRQRLQDQFGGRGIGFVPITSESARTRASIKHRFSNNWEEYTYMKKYDAYHPYGVAGSVFYAPDSLGPQTLSFLKGVNRKNSLMPQPVLYYGQAANDSALVKMVIGEDTTQYKLQPNHPLNSLKLSTGILAQMDLSFEKADSIPFYGVNFDIPTGIQVDNFSTRGNSGLPLTQLNTALMRSFQKEMNYDLIVLHFGTNVLNSNNFAYGWYKQRMERVVDHLRNAFPQTSILVVSIADKSKKYGTEMKTDSAVNYLLSAQRRFAKEKKTGFINLYALMGGEGSMVKWVEDEPVRANKDYTHFNPFGAKKVAQMITDEILNGFEEFKKEKAIEAEQAKQAEEAQKELEEEEKSDTLEEKPEEQIKDTIDADAL